MKSILCMLMTAVMIAAVPGRGVCAQELDLNPNMEIVQEDPVGEAERRNHRKRKKKPQSRRKRCWQESFRSRMTSW